ncbi:MAG: hypothetical protein LUO80_08345 [Methylococcaceae bacterium]|jgi:hypothetical protein|nr:hypothetical protein [Methylococcaceae bacterium]
MQTHLKNWLPRPSVLLFGTTLILSSSASATNPVNEEAHQSFEKKFAEMCIEKEKSDLKGSGVLLSEVTSVCECIAREESKRVTGEEVREFVIEGKYPASLMMKSNAATYTCLQEKK